MSIEVLQTHYGMPGDKYPTVAAIPFEAAFGAALAKASEKEFHWMCPLLVITTWDWVDLIRSTEEVWKGRLRLAGAIAMFLYDYDPTDMVCPLETKLKLEKLENALQGYNMLFDPFNKDPDPIPDSAPPGFFKPHKLIVEWRLDRCWWHFSNTLQENADIMGLFLRAVDEGPVPDEVVQMMGMPVGKRVQALEAYIRDHPRPVLSVP